MLKDEIIQPFKDFGKEFAQEFLSIFTEAFFNTPVHFSTGKKLNRMEEILKSCGLETEIRKVSDSSYEIVVPLGKTIGDFEKHSEAIQTAIGNRNCEITFRLVGESLVLMTLNDAKLDDKYDFEPVTLPNPAEILIGHSRRGIVSVDLTNYPNMLIAGSTGSGKSSYLVQLILNTILTNKMVTLHLIDLKSGIEFHNFENCSPVESFATDIEGAGEVISKLERVMVKRQGILAEAGVVKLDDYNDRNRHRPLPYQLVVVDEFADLREERAIKATFDKLLRKGRNVGIFFVLSTQRPTVDTIPGNFSANIQCRLAFHTSTRRESIIILGPGHPEAARSMPIGRAIFQAYDTITVQPMYIKNDEKALLPFIRPYIRPKNSQRVEEENINMSGRIKC